MSGFPIRTPWDHSLVDSSPRPIAASHVLHRLLVPRHPPFALDNLTTENKMLASTVQFSTNDQPKTTSDNTTHHNRGRYIAAVLPGTETNIHPGIRPGHQPNGRSCGLFFQDPTGCCVCS